MRNKWRTEGEANKHRKMVEQAEALLFGMDTLLKMESVEFDRLRDALENYVLQGGEDTIARELQVMMTAVQMTNVQRKEV